MVVSFPSDGISRDEAFKASFNFTIMLDAGAWLVGRIPNEIITEIKPMLGGEIEGSRLGNCSSDLLASEALT